MRRIQAAIQGITAVETRRRLIALLLAVAMVAPSFGQTVVFARGGVQVAVGVPTLWTLEQAHYLLARQRFGNQNLKAQFPNEQALDPNAIHGSRLSLLRSFFGAEVGFDEATGRGNEIALDNRTSALASRSAASARLENLRNEELTLVRRIGELKVEAAALGATGTPREVKNAEIQAKEMELEIVKARITEASTQAGTAPPATELKSPALGTINGLDGSVMSDVVKNVLQKETGFVREPKLHASTILDNYVQMQYELIAKQLSLLRDDVGVENRLVFVELPHTIYVPATWTNKRRLIQSWWRLQSYKERYELRRHDIRAAFVCYLQRSKCQEPELQADKTPRNLDDWLERFMRFYGGDPVLAGFQARGGNETTVTFVNRLVEQLELGSGKPLDTQRPYDIRDIRPQALNDLFEANLRTLQQLAAKTAASGKPSPQPGTPPAAAAAGGTSDTTKPAPPPPAGTAAGESTTSKAPADRFLEELAAIKRTGELLHTGTIDSTSRDLARAVDLIPRQSALNVNSVHDKQVYIDVGGFFQSLFGFGAKTRYQRQREEFEQFVHQDVFASGFGRGSPEFGWTFGPLPGSNHVASGTKITYVALVIPRRAVGLTLEGFGCDLGRKATRPLEWDKAKEACDLDADPAAVELKVPGELEGFSVQRVDYATAEAGEIATLSIIGDYFSPQIGALVNGVPLRRPVGLAQVELNGALNGLDGDGPIGELEFVNQQLLVMRVRMGKSYVGKPRITLVTPQRVGDLKLPSDLFRAALSVTSVLLTSAKKNGTIAAQIAGTGLKDADVQLNGSACSNRSQSSAHIGVQCQAQPGPTWVFEVSHGDATVTFSDANPLLLEAKAGSVAVVIPASGNQKERVIVSLEVNNFSKLYDRVELLGGSEQVSRRSASPTAVLVEVEPTGAEFSVNIIRDIDGFDPQSPSTPWIFTRDSQAGKWKAKD